MRRFALALLIMLALALPAAAQTVVTDPATAELAWDHDGQALTGGGFRLYIDAATTGTDLTSTDEGDGSWRAAFPALTPGDHELEVSAYNPDVESPRSNILAVRVAVVPQTPTGLRLITAANGRVRWGPRQGGEALVHLTAVLTADGWQPATGTYRGRWVRG